MNFFVDFQWVNPCTRPTRVFHNGQWYPIVEGTRYFINGEWVDLECIPPPEPEVVYLNSVPNATGVDLTGLVGTFGMSRVIGGVDQVINSTGIHPNSFVGLYPNRASYNPYIYSYYAELVITSNTLDKDVLVTFTSGGSEDITLDNLLIPKGQTGTFRYKGGLEQWDGQYMNIYYTFFSDPSEECMGYQIQADGAEAYVEYIGCDGSFASLRVTSPVFICTDGSGYNVTSGSVIQTSESPCGGN